MSDTSLPPFPWSVDPDDRPNMEWNNHIIDADGNTVCFMACSAIGSDNSSHENAAELIASLGTILADRDAALARAEKAEELADKYKWQVRDTCTRAEAAEAELAQIKDGLRKAEGFGDFQCILGAYRGVRRAALQPKESET